MARPEHKPSPVRPFPQAVAVKSSGSITLLTVIVVVAVLYFAHTVFVPLALSLLVAFLLAPLVTRVRRAGVGRVLSVGIVVVVAFGLVAITSALLVTQLSELARRMPEYESNIRKKVEVIRSSAVVKRGMVLVQNLNRELAAPKVPKSEAPPADEKPVPVEIRRDAVSPMDLIQTALGSAVSILLTTSIVVVFVIFMLIQREDLRDRIIQLAGERRVSLTTKLLDDAAQRVSRYLLAQFAINFSFGLLAALGLWAIGVPNPMLWGLLAAILRYVPYLGIWIAAILPMGVAFAVEPGWVKVPAIVGLYLGVDLIIYNFVEPLLYGSSTGVSPIAILAAAVFWTWLWGPVGLLLATPLTVCVVSLGRYVPQLRFLNVLLSDEEALAPETRFYQRMLAADLDEATDVAEEFLKESSLEQLFDGLILPSLRLAEDEKHKGLLDAVRHQSVIQSAALIIDDLADRADELIPPEELKPNEVRKEEPEIPAEQPGLVLCIPAKDEVDELATQMLAILLQRRGVKARAIAPSLAGECVEIIAREEPRIACVCSVPPLGYMHARYLCRRIQDRFRDVKLLAAVFSGGDVDGLRQRKPGLAADEVAVTLEQAAAGVLSLLPIIQQQQSQAA